MWTQAFGQHVGTLQGHSLTEWAMIWVCVHSTAKQREETEFRGRRHLNTIADWFSLNLARQSSAEGLPDLPGLSMNWFIAVGTASQYVWPFDRRDVPVGYGRKLYSS